MPHACHCFVTANTSHISTSKCSLAMVCFVHFGIEVPFAPQWRALFQHLNFQKWSKTPNVWHFWLWYHNTVHFFEHVNFHKCSENGMCFTILTSKCASHWGVFTSKCASRHNCMQFVFSYPSISLPARRFREPTFREVWQNCFLFWFCQLLKIEAVWQSCCVFVVVNFLPEVS